MDRPSSWILAFLALAACTLGLAYWVSGGQRPILGRPAPDKGPTAQIKKPLIGEGFVKLENGEGAAEAEVLLLGTDTRVRADDTGRFRIPLPFRECTLVAHDGRTLVALAAGFVPSRDHGLLPVPDLTLSAGARVQGIVRIANGAPLPATRVGLRTSLGRREVLTGPEGTFAFEGQLAEAATIDVPAQPGLLAIVRKLTIAPRGTALELAIAKDEPLTLVVVDPRGSPRASVLVTATDADGRRAEATTDANGTLTLRGIAREQLVFTAHSARGETVPVLEYDDAKKQLTIRV